MSVNNKKNDESLESETAAYFFNKGYFVRRRIALKAYMYPKFLEITDIDVLGFYICPDFSIKTIAIECKSGNFKKVDRIIWLLGLKQLLSVDQVYLATNKGIDLGVKNFAQNSGVNILLMSETYRQKELLHIPTTKETQTIITDFYKKTFQGNNSLSKLYWFLRAKYWFNDPYLNAITIMEAFSEVTKNFEPKDKALSWLIIEAVILLSLAVLRIISNIYGLGKQNWRNYLALRLKYGKIRPYDAQKLLKLMNEYIHVYLKQRKIRRSETRKLDIPQPKYTKDLIDLIDRLISRPNESCEVPRILDYLLYYNLFIGDISENYIELLNSILKIRDTDIDIALKLGKNVINLFTKYHPRTHEIFKSFTEL